MLNFPSDVLEQIRLHLEEEKRKTNAQIQELTSQDPFSKADRTIDNAASDTEASEESDHDRYEAMIEETKTKLNRIDEALSRIGAGSYGHCATCQEMIDTDRLAILPTATLCLSCEEKHKQKKR